MNERTKIAKRVTWIGFFVNLILTLAKLFAGIIGKSAAMTADAIHSLSDFLTDIVVIAFVNISGKESDENHHYGHGKFETFATLIIALVLFGVGAGILITGVEKIISSIGGDKIEQPGMIAFWAAIISIIAKEILFRYTLKIGKEIKSDAVIANGWHHRSDAFSSIGTALGISGAIFLGENWRILDPIAGVIVSFFIMKIAVELSIPSIKELLESSLSLEITTEIEAIITSHPEIIRYHHLRTRKIGSIYAIDVHIKIDKETTFIRSHDIASELETELRNRFGKGTQTSIHTEPV
ncbi:MAG: cation-efflux pump [Bacteroidetes bacterium HGW-Bacteroidetes-8]|jgi:cation diffusion facilitator family transporter|nr:MAG: cation-efflux pump [Bacteroidetes bacterium HGW-Bacteroidetes-8]